jgi:quinol-cytochrome oxidoreductase complex cytochrome b subunit
MLALLLLPFYDRSPFRHWRKRRLALGLIDTAMAGIVGLTIVAAVTAPRRRPACSRRSAIGSWPGDVTPVLRRMPRR